MTMQDNQDLGNCEDQHPPSLGTVLLVEDNLRVSDELSLVLTTAGYATRCAYDGEHMRALLAMRGRHQFVQVAEGYSPIHGYCDVDSQSDGQ
jgi:hypothetical protein